MGAPANHIRNREGRAALERMIEWVLASSLMNQRKVVQVELFNRELDAWRYELAHTSWLEAHYFKPQRLVRTEGIICKIRKQYERKKNKHDFYIQTPKSEAYYGNEVAKQEKWCPLFPSLLPTPLFQAWSVSSSYPSSWGLGCPGSRERAWVDFLTHSANARCLQCVIYMLSFCWSIKNIIWLPILRTIQILGLLQAPLEL